MSLTNLVVPSVAISQVIGIYNSSWVLFSDSNPKAVAAGGIYRFDETQGQARQG